MIKLLSTKIVDLTPELAEDFATMPEWGGERPLRAKRLEFLRSRLDDGLFHTPRWACAWLNGRKFRMNGQHSSNMLLAAGPAFPRFMQAIIDEYQCDNELDLCTLFSQFDSPESTRNTADVIGAHAGIHEEIRNIPPTYLQLIIAGVVVHRSEGESSKYPAEERGRLVHENIEFICLAMNYVRRFEFRRPGVTGAMYATWERSHERTSTPPPCCRVLGSGARQHASRSTARNARPAQVSDRVSAQETRSQDRGESVDARDLHEVHPRLERLPKRDANDAQILLRSEGAGGRLARFRWNDD